jgi:SAM-dependent methyltransferase
MNTKDLVREFWENNPCGFKFTPSDIGTRQFFEAVERFRYEAEGHILKMLPLSRVEGKSVLEIGCGLGTDGSQFAKHGAKYVGMDLTSMAVQLTQRRFQLFGFPGSLLEGDAENLPFEDEAFDIIYSHGVLHHTPDTQRTFDEIHRTLRTGGQAILMLYHRHSWNYWGNIVFLRRLGAALLAFDWGPSLVNRLTGENIERLKQHQQNLREQGARYLRLDNFLCQNTDGPGNPLSKVYTRSQVKKMLKKFSKVETQVAFLNRRWLPLVGKFLPASIESRLARLWGWHLWIFAIK